MGFDADAAAAAAAAAGGSAELAAELLMGGTLAVHDSGPVDVTRRASRLQCVWCFGSSPGRCLCLCLAVPALARPQLWPAVLPRLAGGTRRLASEPCCR